MADSRLADEAVAGLALRLRAGDAEALDAWYRLEWPRVHRLCFGFLASAFEADDAAQDAMLHLADRIDAWDARRPYGPWRNTIVLNLCRDRERRNEARRRAERAAAATSFEAGPPRVLPSPEDAAMRAEVREALEASLVRLPPREREAFVLVDLEDSPTAGAAEAMGVGESTVRSLVTLARRRLRNLLGDRVAGPPAGGPTAEARR